MSNRGFRITAALLSGLLFYFSLRLDPLWFVAWLAPIPIFLAAFYAEDRREAALLSYLAEAIGLSSNVTYYLKTTSPIATPLLLALQVLMWGFFVVRTRALVRASNSWLTIFVYPIFAVGISTLISFLSPHGTWGGYVYTQMNALPVIQIAFLLGPSAAVFVLALFSSWVAVVLYRGLQIQQPQLAYGLPHAIIAVALGYGFARSAYIWRLYI